MNRHPAQLPQSSSHNTRPDHILSENGLSDLVPLARRPRVPIVLRPLLLALGTLGFLGLPLGGALLCLAAATIVEGTIYSREQHLFLIKALFRTSCWDRFRPIFCWPLLLAVGIVSLVLADNGLLVSLARVGYLLLCLRAIEEVTNQPERYSSISAFRSWLRHLFEEVMHIWSNWYSASVIATTVCFALNLAAPGIWASVGNADWSRLLVFGVGLSGMAMLTILVDSRSLIRKAIQESMQNPLDLQGEALRQVLADAVLAMSPAPDTLFSHHAGEQLLQSQLEWKQTAHLLARVARVVEESAFRRLRRGSLLASLAAILLIFGFLAGSVFLIVPRDVMVNWVAAGQAGQPVLRLAFDQFNELFGPEFIAALYRATWSDLLQEPLLKIAFLEAAAIVSLLLFRTAANRASMQAFVRLDQTLMGHRLQLGVTYLALLENRYQYLYSGFAARQHAGGRARRPATMRNDVLLAPSVKSKINAYRSVSDFLHTSPPAMWSASTGMITVFSDFEVAQEWAVRFLRLCPDALTSENGLGVSSTLSSGQPQEFWIWSGDQLVHLNSLQEAEWYGRFVARKPDFRSHTDAPK